MKELSLGTIWLFLKKTENRVVIDPAILLLSI